MKIANTALLLAATIGAASAKGSPLRRARNLQNDDIEADRRNSAGQPFDGDLGTVTPVAGDCVYDFDDEDMFEVLTGSPAAMTCVGTRCNPELQHYNVVGVKFEELKKDKILAAYFNVHCPSMEVGFGLSCPPGFNVAALYSLSFNEPVSLVGDCSNVPIDSTQYLSSGNYCIFNQFSIDDTQTKFKYLCVATDYNLYDINWD